MRREGLYRTHRVRLKSDRKEGLRVEGIISESDTSNRTLIIADIKMAVDDTTEVLDAMG